jgi:hypothetical protein
MAYRTQRAKEGYLHIDNRLGGPLPDDQLAVIAKLEAQGGYVAVAPAGGTLESATITCSHCHTTLLRNPQRTRGRGYCPKCDHYICDGCEALRVATGVCYPMKKLIDVLQEQAYQQGR